MMDGYNIKKILPYSLFSWVTTTLCHLHITLFPHSINLCPLWLPVCLHQKQISLYTKGGEWREKCFSQNLYNSSLTTLPLCVTFQCEVLKEPARDSQVDRLVQRWQLKQVTEMMCHTSIHLQFLVCRSWKVTKRHSVHVWWEKHDEMIRWWFDFLLILNAFK